MPELVDLYAMISRMRVLNMPQSVRCADNVMRSLVDTYFAPNRTVADLRELVKTGGGVDPCARLRRSGAGGTAYVHNGLKGLISVPEFNAATARASGDAPREWARRFQVITVGALRPVRFSISARLRESAMRGPSAACVS